MVEEAREGKAQGLKQTRTASQRQRHGRRQFSHTNISARTSPVRLRTVWQELWNRDVSRKLP